MAALLWLAPGGALAQQTDPGEPPEAAPAEPPLVPAVKPAPAPAPVGAAVFPFPDRRQPARSDWLGAFLRTGIEDALRRSGRVPVLDAEAARIWAAQYGAMPGNSGGDPLRVAFLNKIGVHSVVRASTQRVVDQAVVYLELSALPAPPEGGTDPKPDGKTVPPPAHAAVPATQWEIRLDLSRQPPAEALGQVLTPLFAAMLPGQAPHPAPQPARWAAAEDFYGLLAALAPGADGKAPRAPDGLNVRLARAQQEPALRGKALAALAERELEQAQVDLTDRTRRAGALRQALRMAADAARLEPWHSRRLALKGEIHYFLKEDYEARTEASVARLRNPLDGLAYAVLALVSGLSTAEGTDFMQQALASDPFLRAEERPQGWAPYQRGALEPLVARWEELRNEGDRWSDPEFERKIAEGEALYNEGRYDEAVDEFRAAQELQVDSHLPRLYLARIRRASGDPEGAANDLRVLSAEYPQEWEVWQEFGLALEETEQFADAEDAFQHALNESPDEPSSLFHLALAQMARERWEAARNSLTILLQKNTRHSQGWLLLGTVETRLERWSEALHAFEQALVLDPQSEKARAGVRLAQGRLRQEQANP